MKSVRTMAASRASDLAGRPEGQRQQSPQQVELQGDVDERDAQAETLVDRSGVVQFHGGVELLLFRRQVHGRQVLKRMQ